jgi:hypothetical protein
VVEQNFLEPADGRVVGPLETQDIFPGSAHRAAYAVVTFKKPVSFSELIPLFKEKMKT